MSRVSLVILGLCSLIVARSVVGAQGGSVLSFVVFCLFFRNPPLSPMLRVLLCICSRCRFNRNLKRNLLSQMLHW